MKYEHKVYLLSICVVALMVYLVWDYNKQNEYLLKNGDITIGELYSVRGNCKFELHGHNYTTVQNQKNHKFTIGELFKVYYKKNDPEKCYCNWEEPILGNFEYRYTTTFEFDLRDEGYSFSYRVDGVNFTRKVSLQDKKNIDLTKKNYKVIYRSNNHRVAYVVDMHDFSDPKFNRPYYFNPYTLSYEPLF